MSDPICDEQRRQPVKRLEGLTASGARSLIETLAGVVTASSRIDRSATARLPTAAKSQRARTVAATTGWLRSEPSLGTVFSTTEVPGEVRVVVAAFESVSTWRQAPPTGASPARRALLEGLAVLISGLSPSRLRVAVDGRTAAGKTTLGHELAAALRRHGRPTARASMDDFKHPWRHALNHGYDRTSGPGYYRNAYDVDSAEHLLLQPAGPDGSGRVVLCAHDPLTGIDHRDTVVDLPGDAVLVVDSVFALRPEYDAFWDYRIWVEVDPALALSRGVSRDTALEGKGEAARLHRERYQVAEELYLQEIDPQARADVVIDNNDLDGPRVVQRRDR